MCFPPGPSTRAKSAGVNTIEGTGRRARRGLQGRYLELNCWDYKKKIGVLKLLVIDGRIKRNAASEVQERDKRTKIIIIRWGKRGEGGKKNMQQWTGREEVGRTQE